MAEDKPDTSIKLKEPLEIKYINAVIGNHTPANKGIYRFQPLSFLALNITSPVMTIQKPMTGHAKFKAK